MWLELCQTLLGLALVSNRATILTSFLIPDRSKTKLDDTHHNRILYCTFPAFRKLCFCRETLLLRTEKLYTKKTPHGWQNNSVDHGDHSKHIAHSLRTTTETRRSWRFLSWICKRCARRDPRYGTKRGQSFIRALNSLNFNDRWSPVMIGRKHRNQKPFQCPRYSYGGIFQAWDRSTEGKLLGVLILILFNRNLLTLQVIPSISMQTVSFPCKVSFVSLQFFYPLRFWSVSTQQSLFAWQHAYLMHIFWQTWTSSASRAHNQAILIKRSFKSVRSITSVFLLPLMIRQSALHFSGLGRRLKLGNWAHSPKQHENLQFWRWVLQQASQSLECAISS